MKVFLFGGRGQMGQAIMATAPRGVTIVHPPSTELDITDTPSLTAAILGEKPDIIINAAGYTAVDRAEAEKAAAFRINGDAVGDMAALAHRLGARLIQLSTDYIFDGSLTRPYLPGDAPNPLCVYGESKLLGEQKALAASPATTIIRTQWLYGPYRQNFLKTMLRLMTTGRPLDVVDDQTGVPTSSENLARAIWRAAEKPELRGVFHVVDEGTTTWYGLAAEIQKLAVAHGLLKHAGPLRPTTTAAYNAPALRPAYSVLDCTSSIEAGLFTPQPWRDALAESFKNLHEHIDRQEKEIAHA